MTTTKIVIMIAIIAVAISIYPSNSDCQKIELNDFLFDDSTDQHIYTENYRCINFSIDMVTNITNEGFHAGYVAILPKNGSEGHCMVWVDNGGQRLYIEPQTDKVYNSTLDFLIEDYHADPNDYTTIDVSINFMNIIMDV